MGCLCIPKDSYRQPIFHWPNFTFSYSTSSVNPRRIHSTFSLTGKHRPKHFLRRRHTLEGGPVPLYSGRDNKSQQSANAARTSSRAPIVEMTDDYEAPPGPPPNRPAQDESSPRNHVSFRDRLLGSNNPFRPNAHASVSQGPPPSDHVQPPAYAPLPGPPPTWSDDKKQALQSEVQYAPPPGPPPSQREDDAEPPPYDPWLAVPDNALLPPPPSIREERSPTANASFDQAARGHAWCKQNPLWTPRQHTPEVLARIVRGEIHLTCPPNTPHVRISQVGAGRTHVRTNAAENDDVILLSDIPLLAAQATRARTHTIYFEMRVISMGREGAGDAGVVIGFVAPPYPAWRLPGWHRGSLGVHGDDGRRYVDDSYGGKDFVAPFRKDDVVGIGMVYTSQGMGGKDACRVFFMRNGRKEGEWDLREERDREEGDVSGLEGEQDLLAAVGCFGAVEFEVRFRREEWVAKAL